VRQHERAGQEDLPGKLGLAYTTGMSDVFAALAAPVRRAPDDPR
jgi:hypothetical protein